MKAITLRNIPRELAEKLAQEASTTGTSLNKVVIRLLLRATGLAGSTRPARCFRDLDHLAGTWTEAEAKAFDRAIADQRNIDAELWE